MLPIWFGSSMNWRSPLAHLKPLPIHEREEWWMVEAAMRFIVVIGCGAREDRIQGTMSMRNI